MGTVFFMFKYDEIFEITTTMIKQRLLSKKVELLTCEASMTLVLLTHTHMLDMT